MCARARLPHPLPGSSARKNFNSTPEKSQMTVCFLSVLTLSLSLSLTFSSMCARGSRTSKRSRAEPRERGRGEERLARDRLVRDRLRCSDICEFALSSRDHATIDEKRKAIIKVKQRAGELRSTESSRDLTRSLSSQSSCRAFPS